MSSNSLRSSFYRIGTRYGIATYFLPGPPSGLRHLIAKGHIAKGQTLYGELIAKGQTLCGKNLLEVFK